VVCLHDVSMIAIGVEGAKQDEEEPSHHHVAPGMSLPHEPSHNQGSGILKSFHIWFNTDNVCIIDKGKQSRFLCQPSYRRLAYLIFEHHEEPERGNLVKERHEVRKRNRIVYPTEQSRDFNLVRCPGYCRKLKLFKLWSLGVTVSSVPRKRVWILDQKTSDRRREGSIERSPVSTGFRPRSFYASQAGEVGGLNDF
jgi:hypothetical protein